ncbi:MAG: class II D-tagatose-bisphosphate aldolase, non-catalytic subunit [Actinomycetes bacterium]
MSRHLLDEVAEAHRHDGEVGVTSVCSAHPLVLDEAVRHGAQGGYSVLIEATCNQVNQDGGYTGLRPSDFMRDVRSMADHYGLAPEQLVVGGDHLGPNPWKHLPAETAMAKSEELVAAFARSGFTKLHLDTSIRCADDPPGGLAPSLVAERAARLAVVAEQTAPSGASEIRYVIGTEVPVPGGESSGEHAIHVSTAGDVSETIDVTELAFAAAHVPQAFGRVRAVVAQPGVEFSDEELFVYQPGQAAQLAECLSGEFSLVFEAHSTDYQPRSALKGLVADHFAILKVGPGLTFAYREALFALSFIEDELLGEGASGVRMALDAAMLANPRDWQSFYPAEERAAAYARRFSRSDRSRYFWPVADVRRAVSRMHENLQASGLPDELVSQYLPWIAGVEVPGSAAGAALGLRLTPESVLRAAIRRVLDAYASAT